MLLLILLLKLLSELLEVHIACGCEGWESRHLVELHHVVLELILDAGLIGAEHTELLEELLRRVLRLELTIIV